MSESGPHSDGALSLAERAYRALEEKLVTLELWPGAMVSESQLIQMTGLGRTPVREAMQRLAQQELFRVMPRKGLQVAPISLPAMLDIFEARKPLERLIVQRASVNARDEQRSGLSAIARDMATAYDSFEAFMELETALVNLLDDCSGNAFASAALAPLRSHCRRFWYYHRPRMQLADAITAQSKLARLVARRDPAGAQRAADGAISVIERLAILVDRVG